MFLGLSRFSEKSPTIKWWPFSFLCSSDGGSGKTSGNLSTLQQQVSAEICLMFSFLICFVTLHFYSYILLCFVTLESPSVIFCFRFGRCNSCWTTDGKYYIAMNWASCHNFPVGVHLRIGNVLGGANVFCIGGGMAGSLTWCIFMFIASCALHHHYHLRNHYGV